MQTHMLWITLAVLPACTIGEGVTVFGEMSSSLMTAPNAVDIVVVYSPEDGDHEAVGTTVTGTFPTGFTLDVPPLRSAYVEDHNGLEYAGGIVWIAKAGTRGTRSDGFAEGELIQMAGYLMLYVVDDPGTRKPYGVAGTTQGWNLVKFNAPTCADRTPLGDGAYGWSINYEAIALDTPLSVQLYPPLTPLPWDPPWNCP